MFNNYAEFLKQTYDAVFNDGQAKPTFSDYLGVLGETIIIIATIFLSAIVFSLICFFPYLCHKKYITKYYNESVKPIYNDIDILMKKFESIRNRVGENSVEYEETSIEFKQKHNTLDLLNTRLTERKIIYWFTILLVWVPLMIPTLLFVLSCL